MTLSPVPGSYCRVYFASDGSGTIADASMREVNLTSQGRARYTVYEITSPTYRYLNPDETPTFQKQVHGSGNWVDITPDAIEYCGGRIFLSTPLNSDDVVRCHSGKYYTLSELFGAATMSFTERVETPDLTCIGDAFVARYPTTESWEASLDVLWAKKCAEYTTSGGDSNSHIRFYHFPGGDAGNSIAVAITVPGSGNQPLTVQVSGNDVTIQLATNADGSPVSTAAQVAAAVNASVECRSIGLMAQTKAGETGEDVPAAMSATNLAGGANALNFVALKGSRLVFAFYDAAGYPAMSAAYTSRSAMGATLTGTHKWYGGVLGPDGKIYCVPYDATDVLIIDPTTGTATRSDMGATLPGGGAWIGGVLGPDGKIYCVPFNATDVLSIRGAPTSGIVEMVYTPYLNKL